MKRKATAWIYQAKKTETPPFGSVSVFRAMLLHFVSFRFSTGSCK